MYTCNGSPKGCEKRRFGHCVYHDSWRDYSVTFELDDETLNRKVIARGVAQAAEALLKDFEQARVLAVVEVTPTIQTGEGK